jgi:hypothetical protein
MRKRLKSKKSLKANLRPVEVTTAPVTINLIAAKKLPVAPVEQSRWVKNGFGGLYSRTFTLSLLLYHHFHTLLSEFYSEQENLTC